MTKDRAWEAHEFALRVHARAQTPDECDFDVVRQICPAGVDELRLARIVASARMWDVLSERKRVLEAVEAVLPDAWACDGDEDAVRARLAQLWADEL